MVKIIFKKFLNNNQSLRINTFTSEGKTNENLDKIFSSKLSYKNSCVKFDAVSRRNGSFIFLPKEGVQKEKC